MKSTKEQKVVLAPGKEKPVKNFHHWIYSRAVASIPAIEGGEVLPVYSASGEFLGRGYFNPKSFIIGRMLTFDDTPVSEALARNIKSALVLRERVVPSDTTAYRLINGEGDFLPGLVVDRYGDVLVLQIATLGMERLKSEVVDIFTRLCQPRCIYEKSNLPTRREEGMEYFEGVLFGELPEKIEIQENGLRFAFDAAGSQKTGFFLDQREQRELLSHYTGDQKVLNCFAYSGGFSLYALRGGATHVTSIDISEAAIASAKENFAFNGYEPDKHRFIVGDVFDFLRTDQEAYDVIVLDPPAFAKRKIDLVSGCRGYKDINRLAMKKISSSGGFLLTSSCSYYVDEKLFQTVVFQAATEAGRRARIIQKHHLSFDHPINIFHPEGLYLKSLLLWVE